MSFSDWLYPKPKPFPQFGSQEMETLLFEAAQKNAAEGDAKAQFKLAMMYWNGSGTPKNEQAALEWAKRAAEQNEPGAQNLIANAYETGQGCSQDYSEAVRWHLAASANAVPSNAPDGAYRSAIALGFLYARELGPPEHACDVLERLKRFDNILMCFCAAIILARGYGVEKNVVLATHLMQRVVELDIEASEKLGGAILEYTDNHRAPVKLEKAREWLEDAASQNIADAQLAMAFITLYGWRGAERNKENSLMWLERAAESGSDRAKALLAAVPK